MQLCMHVCSKGKETHESIKCNFRMHGMQNAVFAVSSKVHFHLCTRTTLRNDNGMHNVEFQRRKRRFYCLTFKIDVSLVSLSTR